MDILKYARNSGIDPEVIESALRLSIEHVFTHVYKIPFPSFCPETKTIDVFYNIPKHIPLEISEIIDPSSFEGGVMFEELPIHKFPPEFFKMTKKYFTETVYYLDLKTRIERWLKRLHTIIDGEILSVEENTVSVRVGNEKAVMTCLNWVKTETNLYRKKNVLKFYISKVDSCPFQIHVSRSSIHLPSLLLKSKYPLYSFKTQKRIIGKISFVHSDIRLTKDVVATLKEIKKNELNNEEIFIIPPK